MTHHSDVEAALPKFGSPIESFLEWENNTIIALGDEPEPDSVWACWRAGEGVCITAKEKRLSDYDSAYASLQQQGLEVCARRSGGTTVPHGEGILAISHITKSSGAKNIHAAYLRFCENIQSVLGKLGFNTEIGSADGAYCDGDYNVLLDGLKLAGTSQRWTRAGNNKLEIVLNHAVMLITRDSASATQRVNQFHQLAEGRSPFHHSASTSLWEARQSLPVSHAIKDLKKQAFFNAVADAVNAHNTI